MTIWFYNSFSSIFMYFWIFYPLWREILEVFMTWFEKFSENFRKKYSLRISTWTFTSVYQKIENSFNELWIDKNVILYVCVSASSFRWIVTFLTEVGKKFSVQKIAPVMPRVAIDRITQLSLCKRESVKFTFSSIAWNAYPKINADYIWLVSIPFQTFSLNLMKIRKNLWYHNEVWNLNRHEVLM